MDATSLATLPLSRRDLLRAALGASAGESFGTAFGAGAGALRGALAGAALVGPLTSRAHTAPARDGAEPARLRIGAAWRGSTADSPYLVGALEVDWERAQVRVRHAVQVQTRAHGLWAEPDGSLLVAALRPGRWLLRLDPAGQLSHQIAMRDGGDRTTFGGHVAASPDGATLYTTETDSRTGSGRIGVRDAKTLRKLDEWPTHGIEPHQVLVGRNGDLAVANGGIPRGANDAKLDLDRMTSSLVWVDGRRGTLRGQWRLPDPRLSIRHLAWNIPPPGVPGLLGLALQAEHDDPAQRAQAPGLAVWNGQTLDLPTRDDGAAGYAGDIAPAADGGFVISNHRAGRAWWWQPRQPAAMTLVAQLEQAYALAGWPADDGGGVVIGAAQGIGRWHPQLPAAMVRWPSAMALENHWVVMA